MKKRKIISFAVLFLFMPLVASAHADIFESSGFQRIIAHIFSSVDHMLALFGVGILAIVLQKITSRVLRYASAGVGIAGIAVLLI